MLAFRYGTFGAPATACTLFEKSRLTSTDLSIVLFELFRSFLIYLDFTIQVPVFYINVGWFFSITRLKLKTVFVGRWFCSTTLVPPPPPPFSDEDKICLASR